MTELFDALKEHETQKDLKELADSGASDYMPGSVASDVKASIIDITQLQDKRIKNLLIKELVLSNITENEVRTAILYNHLVMDFVAEQEQELGAEWQERMLYWLLVKRSVGFKQQEILATQIKSLQSLSNDKTQRKELI